MGVGIAALFLLQEAAQEAAKVLEKVEPLKPPIGDYYAIRMAILVSAVGLVTTIAIMVYAYFVYGGKLRAYDLRGLQAQDVSNLFRNIDEFWITYAQVLVAALLITLLTILLLTKTVSAEAGLPILSAISGFAVARGVSRGSGQPAGGPSGGQQDGGQQGGGQQGGGQQTSGQQGGGQQTSGQQGGGQQGGGQQTSGQQGGGQQGGGQQGGGQQTSGQEVGAT